MPPVLLLVGIVVLTAGCERRDVGSTRFDPGPPVARVNGNLLYQKEFAIFLPEDYQAVLTVEERRNYLDRWITTQLLYDAALASGLGDSDEVEAQLLQLKKDLIADQMVQKVIREQAMVSEEEARRFYDARPNEYTKEYRVSHILVSTLEDADKVATLLQKQSFSWVARRNSIDRHTGPGGDLGFLSKGNMIPEFEQIVFNMQTGDVSDVIESDFGYHFVKVTEIRNARHKLDYEDVAEDITRNLLLDKRSAVYDSLIHALRDNAQIELLDPEMRLLASEADSSR